MLCIGQPTRLAGDGHQQGAELDPAFRFGGLFQDDADYGLGTSAMLGLAHPQRAMHFVGDVADCDGCHCLHSIDVLCCTPLMCFEG